jgi:hypothetical protein
MSDQQHSDTAPASDQEAEQSMAADEGHLPDANPVEVEEKLWRARIYRSDEAIRRGEAPLDGFVVIARSPDEIGSHRRAVLTAPVSDPTQMELRQVQERMVRAFTVLGHLLSNGVQIPDDEWLRVVWLLNSGQELRVRTASTTTANRDGLIRVEPDGEDRDGAWCHAALVEPQ